MNTIFLYLGSILLANALVSVFGVVTVLGLTFPAGAAVIGLTFSFRDMLQQKHGKWGCWKWMMAAMVITLLFNQTIAAASMIAFTISEGVDWAVFTYSKGSFKKRLIMSNIFGTPLDSVVFVVIAFGWNWPAIWGQTIIKLISSLAVLLFKKAGAGGGNDIL